MVFLRVAHFSYVVETFVEDIHTKNSYASIR